MREKSTSGDVSMEYYMDMEKSKMCFPPVGIDTEETRRKGNHGKSQQRYFKPTAQDKSDRTSVYQKPSADPMSNRRFFNEEQKLF